MARQVTNQERIDRGQLLLAAHHLPHRSPATLYEALVLALGDIQHFAETHGINFEQAVADADYQVTEDYQL